MRLRFWGTRGSLPKPGPTTMRYGGNTPCVEVRTADEQLVVLDGGTGVQGLGQALLASGGEPVHGHVLLTHMHWDHIQGLPFFAPLFAPGNEWDIYGPGSPGQPLQAVLAGQMGSAYIAAGFAAGVTDYLPMPCKPTYVRSRVCGWLLRTCQETPAGAARQGPG